MPERPPEHLQTVILILNSPDSLSGHVFVQWLGNLCKTFYELAIMAHEAKEGSNLSVSLWWCALSDGLLICITRLNTSFRYLMGQIVYLFFEETTL